MFNNCYKELVKYKFIIKYRYGQLNNNVLHALPQFTTRVIF
jgi:hypothetical protein